MANQRDKTSIFLTIFIIFLIIAMGVYGFIYRDKIGEYVQKITKKSDNVEKHTVKTSSENTRSDSKERDREIVRTDNLPTKEIDSPSHTEHNEKSNVPILPSDSKSNENSENYKKPAKKNSKKDPTISDPEYGYFERENVPDSEKENSKLDFSKNIPGNERPYVATNLKSKKKISGKKIRHKRSKMRKSSLERRVTRLEKRLRAFSPKNKKKNLEKRVLRLEKIVSKKKK